MDGVGPAAHRGGDDVWDAEVRLRAGRLADANRLVGELRRCALHSSVSELRESPFSAWLSRVSEQQCARQADGVHAQRAAAEPSTAR